MEEAVKKLVAQTESMILRDKEDGIDQASCRRLVSSYLAIVDAVVYSYNACDSQMSYFQLYLSQANFYNSIHVEKVWIM